MFVTCPLEVLCYLLSNCWTPCTDKTEQYFWSTHTVSFTLLLNFYRHIIKLCCKGWMCIVLCYMFLHPYFSCYMCNSQLPTLADELAFLAIWVCGQCLDEWPQGSRKFQYSVHIITHVNFNCICNFTIIVIETTIFSYMLLYLYFSGIYMYYCICIFGTCYFTYKYLFMVLHLYFSVTCYCICKYLYHVMHLQFSVT